MTTFDFKLYLDYCASLGIPWTSNLLTIKSTYQALIKRDHPDVATHLSPQVATDRVRNYNLAYEYIVGHREAFSLEMQRVQHAVDMANATEPPKAKPAPQVTNPLQNQTAQPMPIRKPSPGSTQDSPTPVSPINEPKSATHRHKPSKPEQIKASFRKDAYTMFLLSLLILGVISGSAKFIGHESVLIPSVAFVAATTVGFDRTLTRLFRILPSLGHFLLGNIIGAFWSGNSGKYCVGVLVGICGPSELYALVGFMVGAYVASVLKSRRAL